MSDKVKQILSYYESDYNVRFGDPEIQSILPRFDKNCDLLKLMLSVAEGKLSSKMVELTNKTVICVFVASKGYPGHQT